MDVDMVYCWCNGQEPAFKQRKNYYLRKETDSMEDDSIGEHRFIDNEELKYSLRSLETYAPWIRHVYIVTDRQIPDWLNLQNPKVTIVDHSEIMPQEMIPVFGSSVIERRIINIPGLAEHFLYGNDDMFFGRPLTADFFFNGARPRVFVKHYEKFDSIDGDHDFSEKNGRVADWMKTNMNAWRLLYKKYGHKEFYVLAHTIDGYTKSLFRATLNRYAESFKKSDQYRFRSPKGISRNIIGLDMAYSGQADLEVIAKPGFWLKHVHKPSDYDLKCYCGSENEKTQHEILRFEPDTFCVNAEGQATAEVKKSMRDFYERLFPHVSSFEK